MLQLKVELWRAAWCHSIGLRHHSLIHFRLGSALIEVLWRRLVSLFCWCGDGFEARLAQPERLVVAFHTHFATSYSQIVLIASLHAARTLTHKIWDTHIVQDLACISEDRFVTERWKSEFLWHIKRLWAWFSVADGANSTTPHLIILVLSVHR